MSQQKSQKEYQETSMDGFPANNQAINLTDAGRKSSLDDVCVWFSTKECEKSGLPQFKGCDGYKKCFAYVRKGDL